MKEKDISRRNILKMAAAGTAAVGLPSGRLIGAETSSSTKAGIALQLYSVRGDCGKNFDKALKQVADIGFKAVEFAGYHNYADNALGLRKQLDDLGMKAAATHIGTNSFAGDSLQKTIDFHKIIGCKYLCVPGDKRFSKPDGSKELAEIFNRTAEKLKQVDMKCGYHNHTHEFDKEGDKTYWELFAERTVKDVVLQQDVGWSTFAGQDAAALIRKYPGRSQVVHLKPTMVEGDEGRPILGEDSVPWAKILKACNEVGGTEWLTIEQEAYLPGKSPMECVKMSLAGLRKIIAAG
jgi:sugar phosphate isomerase/epimerase